MWNLISQLIDWFEEHPNPYEIDHELLHLLDGQDRDLLNDCRLQSCIEDSGISFWDWMYWLIDGYLHS